MAKKTQPSIQQTAIGDGNVQVAGDKNTVNVNQTFIQKVINNIFRSDAETLEQRNRRIMLGHVENFWVKGILEKSLHGAALLELGIKEDPDALTYPWAIKREATKEALPAGTSMLEIFQEIGMGRSLLILGAPGSGKTTMLLELTRQLIERAREDVTEPIPVVFNLSSWTEKLTLADWLARELNVIYTIPRKIAPTWVKENKMLLLLDGLDEVRQESRDQCVDAINQFRKENGLTSIAVCSRSQDYADLKVRLFFDGAIEIQPLTLEQASEYFERFGNELAGIRKLLEKDTVLCEMVETPLFLSIMTLAYLDIDAAQILVSENTDKQRMHLFNTYIERMLKRPERAKRERFEKHNVLHWLPWLARKMTEHGQVPFLIERIQPTWLDQRWQFTHYKLIVVLSSVLMGGVIMGLISGLIGGLSLGLVVGLSFALTIGLIGVLIIGNKIDTVDVISLDPMGVVVGLVMGLISGLVFGLIFGRVELICGLVVGLIFGGFALIVGLVFGLKPRKLDVTTRPGESLYRTANNFLFVSLIFGLIVGLISGLSYGLIFSSGGLIFGLSVGLSLGMIFGLMFGGGFSLIQNYSLRFVLSRNNLLPWRLIPFLNHCVDLIFLRRVGGGYIFVHRLLMEHFAAMYQEE